MTVSSHFSLMRKQRCIRLSKPTVQANERGFAHDLLREAPLADLKGIDGALRDPVAWNYTVNVDYGFGAEVDSVVEHWKSHVVKCLADLRYCAQR